LRPDYVLLARVVVGLAAEDVNSDLLLRNLGGAVLERFLNDIEQEVPQTVRLAQMLTRDNPLSQLPSRILFEVFRNRYGLPDIVPVIPENAHVEYLPRRRLVSDRTVGQYNMQPLFEPAERKAYYQLAWPGRPDRRKSKKRACQSGTGGCHTSAATGTAVVVRIRISARTE
jgi:hypothetical protein